MYSIHLLLLYTFLSKKGVFVTVTESPGGFQDVYYTHTTFWSKRVLIWMFLATTNSSNAGVRFPLFYLNLISRNIMFDKATQKNKGLDWRKRGWRGIFSLVLTYKGLVSICPRSDEIPRKKRALLSAFWRKKAILFTRLILISEGKVLKLKEKKVLLHICDVWRSFGGLIHQMTDLFWPIRRMYCSMYSTTIYICW